MKQLIKDTIRNLTIYKGIVTAKSPFSVSLGDRIKMNLKGFTADQYVLFGLDKNNDDQYISEFEREQTKKINQKYTLLMDNKLVFEEVFSHYVNVPKNLCWIDNQIIYDLDSSEQHEHFFPLLKSQNKLVLKPVQGTGGGRGVHIIALVDNTIYWDKTVITEEELEIKVKELKDYVISSFVYQHDYAKQLYEATTNTIRIVTINNEEAQTFDIPVAVHRIGVSSSIPVDNASKGALVAPIDLETGVLTEAKHYHSVESFTHHPDNGNPIKGVQVPNWEELKNEILKVAAQFPYLKFIAWDIVITDEGYSVIEINKSSGLRLFQLWEGQRNKPLGEFYKQVGVIK